MAAGLPADMMLCFAVLQQLLLFGHAVQHTMVCTREKDSRTDAGTATQLIIQSEDNDKETKQRMVAWQPLRL